jgi:hypothetical protein
MEMDMLTLGSTFIKVGTLKLAGVLISRRHLLLRLAERLGGDPKAIRNNLYPIN